MAGLISKKVKVLDCNCSWNGSKQGEARRYDYCQCKARVEKGKRGGLVLKPEIYILGTVFIAGHPEKVWRGS